MKTKQICKIIFFALGIMLAASFAYATFIEGFSQLRLNGALSINSTSSLSLIVNEVSRLFITDTGKVGIGTTSPQNTLDVEGGAVIGATYSGANTAPSNGLLVEGNVGIGTTNPNYLLQVASGTDGRSVNLSNVLYVNGSSGNVGIGTTSPINTLTIIGSVTSFGSLNATSINATSIRFSSNVVQVPRGHIFGLNMSTSGIFNSNATDIFDGEAASDNSSASARVLLNAGAMTKLINKTWANGTNDGGRDSSDTLTGSKTFHAFIFRRNNSVDDYLFSTSLSPTLPDNGTHKRRIGSILWDGASIVNFTQDGDLFQLKSTVLDFNAAAGGTTAVLRTLTVPNGTKVVAQISVSAATNAQYPIWSIFSDPDTTDNAASNTNSNFAFGASGAFNILQSTDLSVRTNTLAQIRMRSDTDTAFRINTFGWIDTRGKDK